MTDYIEQTLEEVALAEEERDTLDRIIESTIIAEIMEAIR